MHKIIVLVLSISFLASSCSSFKAKRVSAEESDKLAMDITDKWVAKDTEMVVKDILKQIEQHKGFKKYLQKTGNKTPKLFIAEVQNMTSEAYFPIDDMNDELLNEFSASGDYILIDAAAREKILKELQYQNDGMVDPKQIKSIGKQAGADLLIFGAVRMEPKSRDGKTIKEYSVNLRMTDIESAVEVLRTRSRINKFSNKKSMGW
jgi:penicillin-binding protein activator